MAPSNFGYSIKEAFRHFFRNWTTSFGAVITIFLSLFIIGLFIIGSVLVNSAIGDGQRIVGVGERAHGAGGVGRRGEQRVQHEGGSSVRSDDQPEEALARLDEP